jgi:hypothetical protein
LFGFFGLTLLAAGHLGKNNSYGAIGQDIDGSGTLFFRRARGAGDIGKRETGRCFRRYSR